MKLRNKKTGEIDNWCIDKDVIRTCSGSIIYNSLAELCEEWEDYEEPKEHWCVTMYGGITRIKDDEEPIDDLIEIGNYFNSKEDAYDAWEKLKAWKRLKDKRFEFNGWEDSPTEDDFDMIWFTMKAKVWDVETQAALDLLFGGKE